MFGAGTFSPSSFNVLQELTQQNLAAFHQALGVFSPFATPVAVAEPRSLDASSCAELEKLRNQLLEIQNKLELLAKKG